MNRRHLVEAQIKRKQNRIAQIRKEIEIKIDAIRSGTWHQIAELEHQIKTLEQSIKNT